METTLYISDLDGTLLNSSSRLSDATRTGLRRLICEEGVNFSIATARTPATVVELLKGTGCRLPLIVMTGAAMWRDGIVSEHFIGQEQVECLARLCGKHGVRPFFYTYNRGMIEAYHLPEMDNYERQFVEQRKSSPYKRFVFSPEMPEERRRQAMLMFAAADYERVGRLHAEARKMVDCSMTYYRDIFNPAVGFLEVMGKGVSKAAAVADLARQVGAGRVVVFGDSPNDLSMRSVATLFVAPENAVEEVRSVADEVIGTNDSDSVVRWIAADAARRRQQ